MSDDPASMYGLRWEIRRSLIERLRIRWDAMGDMANQQRYEAANEIATMMDEIEAWRQSSQKADRDIAELRAERDGARRELHEMRLERHDEQRWDCFKEKP